MGLTTVKHRNPNQIRTGNFLIFLNFKWFGNKLVRKILVLGFSSSERTNSGMVGQQELWTNLSVYI